MNPVYAYITKGIFKLLRSPGINFKESVPPAYVAWRAGTTTLLYSFSAARPTDCFKILEQSNVG